MKLGKSFPVEEAPGLHVTELLDDEGKVIGYCVTAEDGNVLEGGPLTRKDAIKCAQEIFHGRGDQPPPPGSSSVPRM